MLYIFLGVLLIESTQYILAIGVFDITDIINNCLGGLLGIALYSIALKIKRDKFKLDKILFIIALILAILFTILYVTLIAYNS